MEQRKLRRILVALLAVGLIAAGTTATAFEERFRSNHGEHDSSAPAKAAPAPARAAAPAPQAHAAPAAHGHAGPALSPQDALAKLLEGNRRFVSGKAAGPNRSAARRAETAGGQKPFAIIVSCADSRVPPEILFDQGIGDLFIVRAAGNVVDDVAIGSIEYAVEHLGANLIVVLGHRKCGAVAATVAGGEAPGHIGAIVNKIKPAVAAARDRSGDPLDNAIKANVKLVSQDLGKSEPILRPMAEDGAVKVVGAYYDIENGAVSVTYNPCM